MSTPRQRFDQVVAQNRCDTCPIRKQCFDSVKNLPNDIHTPSCEDTLWHYVMTGEFLENEKIPLDK